MSFGGFGRSTYALGNQALKTAERQFVEYMIDNPQWTIAHSGRYVSFEFDCNGNLINHAHWSTKIYASEAESFADTITQALTREKKSSLKLTRIGFFAGPKENPRDITRKLFSNVS